MPAFLKFAESLHAVCSGHRLTSWAAALSYYLTLTFFPLIICLYALLGSSYEKALGVLELLKSFLAPETASLLHDFLDYVSHSRSDSMLATGLLTLLSSASAAERSLQSGVGRLQGGVRFKGLRGFAASVIFALLFLAALYIAVVIMLTGREALSLLSRALPFVDPGRSWSSLRFLLLAGIELLIIWAVYEFLKPGSDKSSSLPGAAFASLSLTLVSAAFSLVIGYSSKYPLIYGSLASVILLMLWLYVCCLAVYLGAAVNVCIKNME